MKEEIINKNLLQLENIDLQEPNFNSYIVTKSYELIQKKLKDFTIEDLRIMINQNISLKYLIPLALEKLQNNLFVDGDLYSGDLLNSVVSIDNKYWNNNENYLINLQTLIKSYEFVDIPDDVPAELILTLKKFIKNHE